MDINASLENTPVVPLVQADDPGEAVRIAHALAAGGLTTIEVVLRTAGALDCLRAIADEVPQLAPGAGTVLSADDARQAIDNGARFVVSPGLDESVVEACRRNGVPVFPGTYTPTEVQRAHNLGLEVVKFFPASIAGGVPALKALSGVFRTMRFMPTGGIAADNLADFLALPAVLACGGSWLTPGDAVAAGDFASVTRLAEDAVRIARQARPPAG